MKTWEDFWINESLTVYIQRKITEKIFGKDKAKAEALMESFNLDQSISNLGKHSPLTALHQNMSGVNPDQAKSSVQYEKGFQMLHQLETIVGEQNFQKFMQTFIHKFYESSATSKDFTQTFDNFVSETYKNDSKKI